MPYWSIRRRPSREKSIAALPPISPIAAAVLTYDYRGIGDSRLPAMVGYNQPKSLVGFKASMSDWAALDVTAAVSWMRERYNTLPLAYIGHSFGGQALGLIANNSDISRAAFVASQAATWRLMTSPEKYRVLAFMNLIGVPLAHALGYTPGWAGIGEDLPKGVFLQWADWVSSPRYLFDSKLPALENFAKFKGELRALCFTDDPWATRPAVELLAGGFTAIKPEVLTVKPSDVGAKAIGHFGFFRPDHRDTLWRGVAEWIQGE